MHIPEDQGRAVDACGISEAESTGSFPAVEHRVTERQAAMVGVEQLLVASPASLV